MNKVFVVCDSELGWDCVIGVFSGEKFTKEKLEKFFSGKYVHVHAHTVEDDLENYE